MGKIALLGDYKTLVIYSAFCVNYIPSLHTHVDFKLKTGRLGLPQKYEIASYNRSLHFCEVGVGGVSRKSGP